MFENLSQTLEGAFKSLSGNSKITEINIASAIKEIRRALVAADVNYKIAKASLSYGQQALWFLQQLAPSSAAYTLSYAARLHGPGRGFGVR